MSVTACPFGPDVQKYWDRRYDLFSRFDEGIQMDREGLFSAMPEDMALAIADAIPERRVIDAMCGLGGTSIALAQGSRREVIAVDLNPDRLGMAKHNASVYGVTDNIEFIHGDIRTLMRDIKAEAIFFDPPWGRPDYSSRERMVNADFTPPLDELVCIARECGLQIYVDVPKNYDLRELYALGDAFTLQKHVKWDKIMATTVTLL